MMRRSAISGPDSASVVIARIDAFGVPSLLLVAAAGAAMAAVSVASASAGRTFQALKLLWIDDAICALSASSPCDQARRASAAFACTEGVAGTLPTVGTNIAGSIRALLTHCVSAMFARDSAGGSSS